MQSSTISLYSSVGLFDSFERKLDSKFNFRFDLSNILHVICGETCSINKQWFSPVSTWVRSKLLAKNI